jgi:hypothetical protein
METIIDTQGWKGKGTNEVDKEGDIYILRCWKKHKETGENYHTEHKIPVDAVDNLLRIIQTNCTPREEYKCYYLWRKVIAFYKINDLSFMGIDREALMSKFGKIAGNVLDEIAPTIIYESFDGKKLRALYYFPKYYFPLLILRAQGYVADLEKTIIYTGAR